MNQSGGANEQEVKEEEKKQEKAETKEPVSMEEHTPIETVKGEKLTNATPPVPPPGEPDLPKQTGGRGERLKKRNKKSLWESRWTSY